MLWESIKSNLGVIVPLFIPMLFTVVNVTLKFHFKVLNARLLGFDLAVAASSLYLGTFVAAIYRGRLTDQSDITVGIILSAGFLLVWAICLSLGTQTFLGGVWSRAQPPLGFVIGKLSLYVSCLIVVQQFQ